MHQLVTWFLLLFVLGTTGCLTNTGSLPKESVEDLETSPRPIIRSITVWKADPLLLQFSMGSTQEMSFLVLAERDNVPFICHVNGGEGESGGWDLKIPAIKDWKKLDFVIDVKKQRGFWIEIELAPECPVGRADFVYSIAPINK